MPSFAIVSNAHQVEARNSIEQVTKEPSTRFDFNGADASPPRVQGSVQVPGGLRSLTHPFFMMTSF